MKCQRTFMEACSLAIDGGLDLGVKRVLPGHLAWYSEIEPAANKVLEYHHPGVPNLGDITKVDWSTVERPNILTGGSPCQDISTAGLRQGMRAGSRSGLWVHMAEAINVLRPDLVVFENVRGILSMGADCELEPCTWCVGDERGRVLRALGAVLGDLADCGYDARWCGLPASAVGAPHGRYRIFVVARPASDPDGFDRHWRSASGLQGQAGSTPRPAPDTDSDYIREQPVGLAECGSAAVAGLDSTVDTPADADRIGSVRPGDARRWWSGSPDHHRSIADPVSERLRPRGGMGGSAGTATQRDRAPAAAHSEGDGWHTRRSESTGQLRGSGVALSGDEYVANTEGATEEPIDWGGYGLAVRRWERVLGRPALAPTQLGKRGGAQLSPRFVEWMMGLPDGYVTDRDITRNEALKMLGNGVVPQQAAAAVRYLLTPIEGW